MKKKKCLKMLIKVVFIIFCLVVQKITTTSATACWTPGASSRMRQLTLFHVHFVFDAHRPQAQVLSPHSSLLSLDYPAIRFCLSSIQLLPTNQITSVSSQCSVLFQSSVGVISVCCYRPVSEYILCIGKYLNWLLFHNVRNVDYYFF